MAMKRREKKKKQFNGDVDYVQSEKQKSLLTNRRKSIHIKIMLSMYGLHITTTCSHPFHIVCTAFFLYVAQCQAKKFLENAIHTGHITQANLNS